MKEVRKMYNSKSVKSEEFIDHEEIMKVLEYGEKNKDNSEMVDEILKKAESLVGLDRYEVSVLLYACKMNFYSVDYRNAKNEQGVWEKVPYYTINDQLPYGHGEKSVYIVSGFMRLTREEAFAIRYHMGFSGIEDRNSIGKAFEMFPLAFALSVADMEATYFLESK